MFSAWAYPCIDFSLLYLMSCGFWVFLCCYFVFLLFWGDALFQVFIGLMCSFAHIRLGDTPFPFSACFVFLFGSIIFGFISPCSFTSPSCPFVSARQNVMRFCGICCIVFPPGPSVLFGVLLGSFCVVRMYRVLLVACVMLRYVVLLVRYCGLFFVCLLCGVQDFHVLVLRPPIHGVLLFFFLVCFWFCCRICCYYSVSVVFIVQVVWYECFLDCCDVYFVSSLGMCY